MDNEDNILFGSRQIFVDICPLHPSPVQIFKLWQIYLDRVNPLLKVTHAPTLQNRIVDAASNLASVDAALQVLMFSIYCITITSLEPEDCQQMLGSSKEDMLMRFRFGCQQALMNASFLQTDEIDCLTGLYLYLVCQPFICINLHFATDKCSSLRMQSFMLALCPHCSALLSESHNVCVFTTRLQILSKPFLTPRCAVDYGGL